MGDPETDADFLWSRSPLSRAAGIRTPLLIAQGANDPRVKQAESEQIVAALREHGIDYEYMLFPDEGHGFAKPENRLPLLRGGGTVPRPPARRPGRGVVRARELLHPGVNQGEE